MPSLHEIQGAFARGILHGGPGGIAPHIVANGIAAENRLSIYRNTARIVMTEALRMAFPAVEALLGPAFFETAAARFQRSHPPLSACLDDYGAAFPAWLAAMPETGQLSYLGDVGRFEWALNVAAHAADMPALDARMFDDVEPALYGLLRFASHPSVTLLRLTFPADRIADAVLSGNDFAMASIDLHEGPVYLAVHRGADGVAAERLTPQTCTFLRRLFAGEPFAAILDREMPDASQNLARQFTLGRLTGFSVATVHPSQESAQ